MFNPWFSGSVSGRMGGRVLPLHLGHILRIVRSPQPSVLKWLTTSRRQEGLPYLGQRGQYSSKVRQRWAARVR